MIRETDRVPLDSKSKDLTLYFEPFVGDGRPGDIAAELLQFFTLIGAPAHRRMRLKPCALTRSSATDGLAVLGRLCKLRLERDI